jgi:hypothetical protein
MEGKSIALGELHGVAYYTTDPDGCHLVVTVAQGEGGQPVRFVTVLAPNQSATLAVPRDANQVPLEIAFRRVGDRILVETSDTGL